MAKQRSAGGDSSRLEGTSSWLKIIPGMFQKHKRSGESNTQLESESSNHGAVREDSLGHHAGDTSGLPTGFSKAYNGLEVEELSIDMRRLPSSDPLPPAGACQALGRLAESCQMWSPSSRSKSVCLMPGCYLPATFVWMCFVLFIIAGTSCLCWKQRLLHAEWATPTQGA